MLINIMILSEVQQRTDDVTSVEAMNLDIMLGTDWFGATPNTSEPSVIK